MSSPQRCLGVGIGFVVGVLLVLLYAVVLQNFEIRVPYVVITQEQRTTDKQQIPTKKEKGKVACNSDGRFSESCEADGDVRINGTAMSVAIVPASRSERLEWEIRPYSRRSVFFVKKVTVKQLPDQAAAPPCTATYTMPAVLFALGGLTGNFWHDYTDVLVPLFAASRRYDGEVQFLVANLGERPRWLGKYAALLKRLSRYDAVALDGGDAHVRCFPHKEFSIVPELEAGGRLSMADFTRFQREAYALPRDAAASVSPEPEKKKPRLMLLHRRRYRRFVNEQEIVRAAEAAGFEAAGFEAAAVKLREDMPVAEQARVVNSFDVLLGVHGAGLTSAVFLPPGAVLIQVVPYGKLEYMTRLEFGEPATDMGLKYLEYIMSSGESTLLELLGPDHPAIRDPDSVHRSGWDKVIEFYLHKQDVRINVTRFAPTLAQAFDHLRQQ